MAGLLGTMVVNFQANVSQLQAGVNQAQSSIRSLAGPAAAVSTGILAIGAAGAAAAAKAVSMAANFQSGLTSLVTGAGESQKNIKMVGDGILNLATQTGTSTKQLTDGMYMIESAGYHGAAGLDVLKNAAMGAKVGNADLGTVANAVTTEMTDYASKNLTAAQATNTLVATVSNGKTTMQALGASLANILPTASAAGVSLTDTSAAMATMTGEGIPAAQAATYLRQTIMAIENPSSKAASAFKAMGLNSSDVAAEMKVSLPGALQMITDAAGKKFPVGSADYIAAISNMVGGTKSMQGILDLTGDHLNTFKGNVTNISNAVKNGGNSITGWANIQQDFNFKMQQAGEVLETFGIKIGQALLPAAQSLVPVFNNIIGVATNVFNFFSNNKTAMSALTGVITVLAGVIGGLLAAALAIGAANAWLFLEPFLTNPFTLIVVAIAGLIALLVVLYNNFQPVRTVMNAIGQIFVQVWNILVSSFMPAWKQLTAAVQQAMPALQMVGQIIGGVLLVALGLVIASITALATGIAAAIGGIVQVLTGFVQIFTGIFNVLAGVVKFFVDLFTGQWQNLGADLGQIWGGIVQIFQGAWNVIAGVFTAAFGFIGGLVVGFVNGIIGFFKGLFDALVGHSIIPDTVNGIITWISTLVSTVVSAIVSFVANLISWFVQLNIDAVQQVLGLVNGVVNWFSQLPGKVMSFLSGLPGMIMNLWNTIITDATNAGKNIVNGIANGIRAAIGAVGSAISDVTSFISAHLPHSPAKIGPLKDLQLQGSLIPEQISVGILSNMSKLDSTMSKLPYPGGSATSNSTNAVLAALAASNNNNGNNNNQPVAIYIDGKEVTSRLGPHIANAMRLQGVRR